LVIKKKINARRKYLRKEGREKERRKEKESVLVELVGNKVNGPRL
jgi:hypothetical protein